MSSLSKKTKYSNTSRSETNLTDWSKNQWETGKADIGNFVDDFTQNNPFVAYAGKEVADLSPSEVKAREMAGTLGPRADVKYRTFDQFNPEVYYTPFEGEVVNAVSKAYDDDYASKIADNQARATRAGTYGGSRHGVMEAELARTSGDTKNRTLAEMRKQGYDDAAGRFQRDSDALYGQDVRNSDKDYNDNMKQIELFSRLGADEREIEQAKLLAERAKYDAADADKWKKFQVQLQTKLGLFSSTPMLTRTDQSGSGTTKYSDPLGELSNFSKAIGSTAQTIGGLFK